MPNYSISAAREQLSQLIDEALRGEPVTIARDGKAVVELRTLASQHKANRLAEIVDEIAKRASDRPYIDDAAGVVLQMRDEER